MTDITRRLSDAERKEVLRNDLLEGNLKRYVDKLLLSLQRMIIVGLIAILGTAVLVGGMYISITKDIERLEELYTP